MGLYYTIVVFQIAYFCKHLTFGVHKVCVFTLRILKNTVTAVMHSKSVERKTLHSLDKLHSGDAAEVV